MLEFPRIEYSAGDVKRAGEFIGKRPLWSDETREQHVRAFRVAYNWRDAHLYPTRCIRAEMGGRIRSLKLLAVTASRTKRMVSIRKKLINTTTKLVQIQDLGGCRAIMGSAADAARLVQHYEAGASAHDLRWHTSYTNEPKPDGYRGDHLIFRFQGQDEASAYTGLRVEMQIRTRLQHAWATAVEAVGMVRKEDLKGGSGNPDWRRLFALMSSEFADVENCPPVPGMEDKRARIEEIRHLDEKLGAARFLNRINNAIRATESLAPSHKSFLIQYQQENGEDVVRVKGFTSAISGSGQYSSDEIPREDSNSVLVEVDKVDSLREAYPNYFLDVGTFAQNVVRVTEQNTKRPKLVRGADLSFLGNGSWRKRLA